MQEPNAALRETVQGLAGKRFAASVDRPRLGAQQIVREGEDLTAEARVCLPDAGLPLVLSALVLTLS